MGKTPDTVLCSHVLWSTERHADVSRASSARKLLFALSASSVRPLLAANTLLTIATQLDARFSRCNFRISC